MVSLRRLGILGMLGSLCFCALSMAEIKHETDIFGKWLAWQQIYFDRNLSELKNNLNDSFVTTFKNKYETNLKQLTPLVPVLSAISNRQIGIEGFQLSQKLDEKMKEIFSSMYDAMENNIPELVNFLAANGLSHPVINIDDQKEHYDDTINKYKAFGRLLVCQTDAFLESEYLLAFANRLFEYCYSDETFPHYQKLLTSYEQYPVARMLNTLVWYHLVGDGWKHWHASVLKATKEAYNNQKELVYVAGGTDFYHLLREGIYNVTIIDPFLPTQARYYSEGWTFLIDENAVGDEVRFGPACNSIKIKCTDYKTGEPFYHKMSNNQILTLKKNVSTWTVFDRNDQQLGNIFIHRRPVTQMDFAQSDKKFFLMSYDEMTFVAAPDMLNGWGIDPTLFDDAIQIHAKQLRKPITKNMLCNIRVASLLNLSDLRFINLASDPT